MLLRNKDINSHSNRLKKNSSKIDLLCLVDQLLHLGHVTLTGKWRIKACKRSRFNSALNITTE